MPRSAKTASVTLALVGVLLVPGRAFAAQPEMHETTTVRTGVLTSCAGYDVTFVATVAARYIVLVDDAGTAVQEIRHVSFTGTLTGPGGQLPYSGHFTRTADFVAQRAVFTGLRWVVPVPGERRLLGAGTDAFSLDPADDYARATGRLPDTFYDDVCAALAP